MSAAEKTIEIQALTLRLAEAEATIEALLSGQIDAVVDPRTSSPVLLFQAQAALRESEAGLKKARSNIVRLSRPPPTGS